MWYCQCCNGWIWRAEVWVWASVPSLLKFKTIICCEIKDDFVLDNYRKCLSTLTTWVVREGEGWHDSVCMCVPAAVGSSSLSPSCSLQTWHPSGGPKWHQQSILWRMPSATHTSDSCIPLPCSRPALSGISEAALSLSTPSHLWSMPSALEGQCQGSVTLLAPLIDFPPAKRVRSSRSWASECQLLLGTITASETSPGVSTAELGAEPGVGYSHLNWENLEV